MNITLDHDLILNALRDADMSADDLRMDYSGRGMYGSDCFGIVGDVQDLALFMVAITDRMSQMDYPTNGDVTAAYDLARAVRSDSMDRHIIFYFPGYRLVEDEDIIE
jgi:hypothetical protein